MRHNPTYPQVEDTKEAIRIRIYRRRTDNTMAKRKGTKGHTTIYKHTYKTKDRVTRTPVKTGGELRCSRRVSSSCSTSQLEHIRGHYPRMLFRLDMRLVYRLVHRRNDVEKKPEKYVN